MEDKKNASVDEQPKKKYVAPAIAFEHPTEALASSCNGTDNCPSKQASGACDSFDSCMTTPNS